MEQKLNFGFDVKLPNNQGIHVVVSEDDFKVCPCGNDVFQEQFRIAYISLPIVGQPPHQLRVQIHVCTKCGQEVSPFMQTKAQILASNSISE